MRNHTYVSSFSFLRFCSCPIKSIQNILSKWRNQTISHLNKNNFTAFYCLSRQHLSMPSSRTVQSKSTAQSKKSFTYVPLLISHWFHFHSGFHSNPVPFVYSAVYFSFQTSYSLCTFAGGCFFSLSRESSIQHTKQFNTMRLLFINLCFSTEK